MTSFTPPVHQICSVQAGEPRHRKGMAGFPQRVLRGAESASYLYFRLKLCRANAFSATDFRHVVTQAGFNSYWYLHFSRHSRSAASTALCMGQVRWPELITQLSYFLFLMSNQWELLLRWCSLGLRRPNSIVASQLFFLTTVHYSCPPIRPH